MRWLGRHLAILLVASTSMVYGYEDVKTAPQLIRGLDHFTFDVYKEVAKEGGNVVISPFNVATCLSMVYLGARGQTSDEMRDVMHLPLSQPLSLARQYRTLLRTLQSKDDAPYQLYLANSLWVSPLLQLHPQYQWMIADNFGPAIDTINFSDGQDAADKINAWTARHTGDKITKLFNERDFDESTRLVLASAVYMKASWTSPFLLNRTKNRPFFVQKSRSFPVEMMQQVGSFSYLAKDNYAMVVLPYDGDEDTELAMAIVLPTEIDGLSAVEEQFTSEQLGEDLIAAKPTRLDLQLPRFSTRTSLSPKEILESLGMELPFTTRANLSGIDGYGQLYITKIQHEAFIDVDEKGTEAAAVTGIIAGMTSAPSQEPKPTAFHADHPFFYVVLDLKTGQYLFIGRVEKP